MEEKEEENTRRRTDTCSSPECQAGGGSCAGGNWDRGGLTLNSGRLAEPQRGWNWKRMGAQPG